MRVWAASLLLLVSSPAIAQSESGDSLTIAPYVWAPTISGTTALGPLSVPVRVTPGDFVDGLKVGGMGSVRYDRDDGFIMADAIIVDYDNKRFRPFFDQALTSKIRYVELSAGLHRRIAIAPNTLLTVSPHIGMQHLEIGSFVTGNLITTTADGRWTNPVAGVTAILPLSSNVGVTAQAKAAGFGLTDTNYQTASLMVDYQIARRVSLGVGYRWAKGEFNSAQGLALDLHGKGPVIGLSYRLPVGRQ